MPELRLATKTPESPRLLGALHNLAYAHDGTLPRQSARRAQETYARPQPYRPSILSRPPQLQSSPDPNSENKSPLSTSQCFLHHFCSELKLTLRSWNSQFSC